MKTRILILCFILVTAALVFAGGGREAGGAGAAAQDAQLTLRIGISTNDQDPRAIAALEFGREIEARTGGNLRVQLFHSGQLGGDGALIEALALDTGTVDIIITDASNFAPWVPRMGISALPFLFADFDTAWRFMDSDIHADVERELISHNMRVLARYCNGFRCVTTGSRVIRTPADMNGMLIRTPENPVIMATMRALGANPQPLAFSELYMALSQGTFDAQENPIPVIFNNRLFEVQGHLSLTNHIYSGMCFTIAESTWRRLSVSQQQIVLEAAQASARTNREMNRRMTEEFLALLETEGGMTITQPDLPLFIEASRTVLDGLAGTFGADLMSRMNVWLTANQ